GIGDVDDRSSGLDDFLDDSAKELRLRTTGILCVKLYILHKSLRKLHRCYSPGNDVLGGRAEFVLNVERRNTDTGMDSPLLGIFERCGGYFDIFLYGTGKCANDRVGNRFGNLLNGEKIPRAGNRKACLNNIHAERFEGLSNNDP